MPFLYRCPHCRKRKLQAVDVVFGQTKTITCQGCGLKKTIPFEQFVIEIHETDPRIQKRRQRVLKGTAALFRTLGIPIATKRRPRKGTE